MKAIAIDTKPIHFGNENENNDLQQSLFVLGARKELMLVIKEGVVCLSNRNANTQSLEEVNRLVGGNQ